MKCRQGYEVKACKSAAGWYLGTTDSNGYPNCRVSTEYAQTEEDCRFLSMDRDCLENIACNGGRGCLDEKVIRESIQKVSARLREERLQEVIRPDGSRLDT